MENQTDNQLSLESRIKDILISIAPFGFFYKANKEVKERPDKLVSTYIVASLLEGAKAIAYLTPIVYLLSN